MKALWITGAVVAALALLAVAIAYVCYRITFYVSPKQRKKTADTILPEGKIYEPHYPSMKAWAQQTQSLPREHVSIRTFDGKRLWGTYYEYAPGAPIELMFHGYRGSANRDLSGGVQRCFQLGRSALLVDQRGSGRSDGHTITFGIKESKDCLCWIEFMRQHFGKDVKIILTGISMGAATVMMAAGKKLPENVIGVLADCGYSSTRKIICKVIAQMNLPVRLAYPFVKLGARLFGGFDLEEDSPERAMKRCRVPVLFFHGESDDFVPCEMSRRNYAACASQKRLVTVPGAGHGLSYPVAPEDYLKAAREFFGPDASYTE